MKVRIRTTQAQPLAATEPGEPSFAELQHRGTRSLASFLFSLSLHLSTVWLVSSTVRAVNSRMALNHEIHPQRALEMPAVSELQPRRLTAPGRPAAPAKSAGDNSRRPPGDPAVQARSDTAKPPDSAGEREQPLPLARQGTRFMLPAVFILKPEKQVLVQIEPPPDLKIKAKVAVPEVMLWQLPVPPKPKPQIVAAHAEEQPVRERETPAVTPQLNARNREQELAEVRHAAAPPVPVPTLPLPVANTTPIRLLDGVQGNRLPNSTGPTVPAPEEVHVISVPDLAVPQASVIVLPSGNQGPPPGIPSGANTGGSAGTSNGGHQTGASNDTHRSGQVNADFASKSGQLTNQAAGTGNANAVGAGGGPNTLQARAAGGGASADHGTTAGGDGSASVGVGYGPTPAGTTRIVRPRDGKYSVVVLGSTNLDAYPEAAGLLSGKLVYSVYIRAGGRKEWVLQYCLPKGAEQAVKLRGSAVPIDAPYPFLIYRPKLTLLNDPDYLIVHGFINAAGRFDHLSTLGDIDAASKALLISALEHWEFRPAARDGEPSVVEIALIIPREPI